MTAHDGSPTPPKPRYRLEIEITGNTLDEIERELVVMTRGGFLLDSDGYRRNEWHAIGGRSTRIMHHQNPDMDPERYQAELDEWADTTRAWRRANQPKED